MRKFQALQENDHPALFRQWIQTIAFKIYEGNGTYITRKALSNLPITLEIQKIIKTNEVQEEALKDLLGAFYFQNVREAQTNTTRYAVEFLHKSLQEYLTIEYILATLQEQFLDDINASKPSIAPELPLKLFHSWFAQKGLSKELYDLLVEQVEALEEVYKKELRQALKRSFYLGLQNLFLYQYTCSTKVNTNPVQQMAHTFEAYWAVLARLNPTDNGDLFTAESKEQKLFCKLLKLLYDYHPPFLQNINLSGADLRRADLRKADLRKADLRKVDLFRADLSGAVLSGVDLSIAKLIRAKLSGVVLSGAKLIGADLIGADLSGAVLSGAVLIGADLSGADLRRAVLSGADLRRVDLSKADLRLAKLYFTKVNSLDFFQNLKNQNCKGIEDLEKHYHVDPTAQYREWDDDQSSPYYLIKEKKHPQT